MLFVLIALWAIAAILLLSDLKRSTTRWLSGVAFCGGAGALAATFGERIIPYIVQQFGHSTLENMFYQMMATSSLISYYGLPYTFLMFAVHYNSSFISDKWKRYLPWVLLIPILLCILFTPGYTRIYPITFHIVALWAVPYIVLGTYLVLSKKETRKIMRRTHQFACLAILPAVLFATVMNYVLPSMGMLEMWRYNTWIIVFGSAVFLYSIFKYGFLGVQFLIERRRIDYTLRAITSGTAILNHSIKNDIGKMRLFTDKIKSYAEETGQDELQQDIEVVKAASQHIQEMVNRVQEQTQDLKLQTEIHPAAELIDQVLLSLQPYLNQNRVNVEKFYENDMMLMCDKTQVSEVLNNIIMNAVEAMPTGGNIKIKLQRIKKSIVIEVKDNGAGINKKDLKKVLEPFYTTKAGSKLNYGLGLAYCYNVMSKHGGSLEIDSEVGQGTDISLHFPAKI